MVIAQSEIEPKSEVAQKKKKEKKKEEIQQRDIDQEDLLGIENKEPANPSKPNGLSTFNMDQDLLDIGLNDETISPAPVRQVTNAQPTGFGLNDFMDLTGGPGPQAVNQQSTSKNPELEVRIL